MAELFKYYYDGLRLTEKDSFFKLDKNLASLIITNLNQESLGNCVCYCCSNLENVVFPKNLKNVKFGAFYGCESLKVAFFQDELKVIGDSSFKFSGLEILIIPENISSIGESAFHGTPLKIIVFGNHIIDVSKVNDKRKITLAYLKEKTKTAPKLSLDELNLINDAKKEYSENQENSVKKFVNILKNYKNKSLNNSKEF